MIECLDIIEQMILNLNKARNLSRIAKDPVLTKTYDSQIVILIELVGNLAETLSNDDSKSN